MSVFEAVERELQSLGADTALAATALAMASEIDGANSANSATSKSMCARVLMEVLGQIRAAAPPKVEEDRVDEIAQRRARRVGSAGA